MPHGAASLRRLESTKLWGKALHLVDRRHGIGVSPQIVAAGSGDVQLGVVGHLLRTLCKFDLRHTLSRSLAILHLRRHWVSFPECPHAATGGSVRPRSSTSRGLVGKQNVGLRGPCMHRARGLDHVHVVHDHALPSHDVVEHHGRQGGRRGARPRAPCGPPPLSRQRGTPLRPRLAAQGTQPGGFAVPPEEFAQGCQLRST
mmetsp:Transcript_79857/g.200962  ORF Transcript_79857/g.200962 Transcript_79857/m.200962 type:complete len:201 (-) Transcript_79857:2009-2611(-)